MRFGWVKPRPNTIEFFAFRHQWNRDIARSLNIQFHQTGSPAPAGTLLVSNHSGFLDINAICATSPPSTMPNFVSKKEVGDLPIFGAHMAPNGDVLFDRKNPDARRKALEDSLARLGAGFSLVVFPEGSRQKSGHPLDKIRPALIEGAIKAGFAVQPIAIKGTTNLLEQPWRLQRINHVHIAYGEVRKDYANAEAVWNEVLRMYGEFRDRA